MQLFFPSDGLEAEDKGPTMTFYIVYLYSTGLPIFASETLHTLELAQITCDHNEPEQRAWPVITKS